MSSLLDTPLELIFTIVTFLDLKEVLSIGTTCKTLHEETLKNSLWYRLCRRHWAIHREFTKDINWKIYFAERFLKLKGQVVTTKEKGVALSARYRHTVTASNGKVVIIGGTGFTLSETYGDVKVVRELGHFEEYLEDDVQILLENLVMKKDQKKHQRLALRTPNLVGKPIDWLSTRHTCCSVGGKIWLFGGSYDSPAKKRNDLIVIDVEKGTWTVVKDFHGQPPSARSDHAMTHFGNLLYVFGGSDPSVTPQNDLHVFDTETMTWSQPKTFGTPPSPRSSHAFLSCGRKLYVFGGAQWLDRQQRWTNISKELFQLDLDTMTWSLVQSRGESPAPATFPSMLTVGHHLLLIEKNSERGLMFFDTVSEMWTMAKPVGTLTMRDCIGMAPLGNQILLFGGYNGVPFNLMACLELSWMTQLVKYNLKEQEDNVQMIDSP